MYLIVGLGNPGKEYEKTRHNTGFNVVNKIASQYDIPITHFKFNGLYGTGVVEKSKVVLVQPQTYMNLSGECIRQFVDFYQIELSKVLVIYDDIDIEVGKIRIRKEGGAGTHNGMKSIVHELKSKDFPRVRVGIGMPTEPIDLMYHVLGKVKEEEKEQYQEGLIKGAKAVTEIIRNGIESAMNLYN